ncbi:TetR/AcrR family transcriptional regulator [Erwinia sp. 9145]|uniref:TetR/AcrR family transcriptional regulator n=1 Tax=Erwinia sp. 9145 TaxID=1500895 RepID=UPI000558879B|nr:TetR/AcrR family transcriptional regulator [Erwinia sp. 9145]
MRADAKKNYNHLLTIAGEVVSVQGVEASLRDIARKADVGMGTLYRHFPSREALLEALLRSSLDELTQRAKTLEASDAADEALLNWSRAAVAFTQKYSGIVDLMAVAMADENSALHASCAQVKSSGARLLGRAQAAGSARKDIDGADLMALIAALGWLNDQPSFAPRADRLFNIIADAIRSAPGAADDKKP